VIDLSNVAGQSNVVIGFRSKSDFGNRQWVDNVIISNNASLCNSTVTTPGVYSCNSLVSLNFSTVGLKPSIFVPTDSSPKIINDEEKDSRIIGTFASAAGNVVVSNTQNDNPTGGVAAVQQYNVNGNNGAGIAVNTTSTNQNGGIYTPTSVVSDRYFTVTYTGNDKAGFATYSISIDVSSYGGAISPNDAYIMKRTDISGKWVCVNTTASGNILTATGLTTFSDFSVGITPVTLTLKTRLEAIQLNRKDTITVNIRSNTAPYPIVETKTVVYDSLTGISSATLSNVVNGTSYFLQIAHRNSISTWSAAPVTVTGGALNYDFTTSVNQAFGSNQVLVSGVASFYTGDVNQDGTADGSDASLIDNDAFNFVSGDYVITDLNYDGTVDASDAAFIDNNAANFVGEIKPPGALNPNNSKNLERASSTNGNR
jgi:hypothetical protein